MAMRVPWDEYEAAILILACVDYNAGKCTKKEAIKNVSQALRKRAENNGITIDDVFRNENGITMQFMLVNELLTQEKCGLRGASKLFINMVGLYKCDRVKFQEILIEMGKTVEIDKRLGEKIDVSDSATAHLAKDNECKEDVVEREHEELEVDKSQIIEAEPPVLALYDIDLYKEEFALILREDYENGFRIKSGIDRDRFKAYYNERFAKEMPLSDEQLLGILKTIGTVREERIYARHDDEQNDILKQIFENVMLVFQNGTTCVYPKAVYHRYQMELIEKLQIYDEEFLGNILISMSAGKLKKQQTFLCLKDKEADLTGDVLKVLKSSPIPMSYADIQEVMWYIPLDKIKHVLVMTKPIVQVEQETYFFAMNLPISEEEITEVSRLIYCALENKTYITDVELRQLIADNCQGIFTNTLEFTTYGIRNCLAYILRDSYSFNGPIISRIEQELSMAEVFAQYCNERERVTTEELKTFASEVNNKIIYWDSVRNEMVRISDELFLRHDKVEFAIDEIDSILNDLCERNYIPLKDIGLFMHFPTICVQWNGYVLESYIYKYSKKFKLLHASFSASGVFGAVVRQDSGIENYQELIIDVLAHSNQWNEKNSALELLVEQGYQQRKRYADIEKIVHEAKLLREKINTSEK